jgi:L-rhamnonate dehydratase
MVDGLGRCHLDDALRLLPVLADVGVYWAEELVPAGSWGWQRLRSVQTGVPLAAGEHAVDEAEQARLLTGGQVDVWQVDVGWGGGLARALHIVETAADLGIPVFPHGAHLDAALALAAVCCRDKVPAVEYHLTVEPLRQQIHEHPLAADGGWIQARTAPGLAEQLRVVGEDPLWSVGR